MTNQPEQVPQKQLNDLSEDQIIDNILALVPCNDAVEVELPSRNKFYNLVDSSKPITIRPLTFEDERAMVSNKQSSADVLNSLLERCVSNIDVKQLLQMDKLYLIMKVREISYGDEYNASITCASCKEDNILKFTLSEMPVKHLEEDATNPVVFELPVLKKEIKIRLPRVSDEHYFANAEYALESLWRFVEEIDGTSSKPIIAKVIPKLPLKDAHTVLDHLSASKYGLDTTVRFVCAFCDYNEVMELPIGTDFFTAT